MQSIMEFIQVRTHLPWPVSGTLNQGDTFLRGDVMVPLQRETVFSATRSVRGIIQIETSRLWNKCEIDHSQTLFGYCHRKINTPRLNQFIKFICGGKQFVGEVVKCVIFLSFKENMQDAIILIFSILSDFKWFWYRAQIQVIGYSSAIVIVPN